MNEQKDKWTRIQKDKQTRRKQGEEQKKGQTDEWTNSETDYWAGITNLWKKTKWMNRKTKHQHCEKNYSNA